MPQGWNASPFYANQALNMTFSTSALQEFLQTKSKQERESFPYTHYRQYVLGFVDDLAVHSKESYGKAVHFLAIESMFFTLKKHGWLISLRKSTIITKEFTFLGLNWDMVNKCNGLQNDRLSSILNHRIPRSTAELCS